MKHLRPLVLIAAALTLLVSACSQPSEIAAPRLEPQLGSPETLYAVGVAVNQYGQLYALTQGEHSDDYLFTQEATLSRYSRSGSLLWEYKLYDRTCDTTYYWEVCDSYRALDVGVDSAGNAYSLTYYEGESCDAANVFYSASVTKLNAAGTWLWGRSVANATSFAVDTRGNIYTVGNNDTGYEYCDGDIDNDPPYAEIVRKYNTNGALLWERKLNATVGTPADVAVSGSGSVYVVGSTGMSRYSGLGGLTWTRARAAAEVAVSGSNLFTRTGTTLRRLDGSGNQLWSRSITGLKNAAPYRLAGDTTGNLYVAGRSTSSSSGEDAFVRKYGGGGSLLWSKGFGTYKYDDARGVATYDGSEIYVAGTTQGLLTEANRSGSGGYLRKMDRSGNRIWTR